MQPARCQLLSPNGVGGCARVLGCAGVHGSARNAAEGFHMARGGSGFAFEIMHVSTVPSISLCIQVGGFGLESCDDFICKLQTYK